MTRKLRALALVLLVLLPVLPGAVGAVAAQSGNQSGDEATAVGSPARLSIEQPHYVDKSVKREGSGNSTLYIVRGSQFELLPQNFAAESVVRFGVRPQDATLSYDQTTGEYIFTPGEQNGTYTLYWVVAEEVAVQGSNETTVEKVRYRAQIQVRKANYAHISQQRFDALQADAANWSEVVSEFRPLGDPDAPIGQKLSRAADAFQFLTDPLAALKGDFTAAAIILLMTNGGRLLLVILLAVPLATAAGELLRARRRDRRLPDIDALEQEELQLWREKRKKVLSNVTPYDLPLPDERAARLTAIGDNLWQILKTVGDAFSVGSVKRLIAQAMGHHGYRLAVPDRAAPTTTDGTTTIPDAADRLSEGDVRIVDPDAGGDEFASDGSGMALLDPRQADKRYTDAVAYDDLDRSMLDHSVPVDDLHVPLDPGSEDLTADLGIEIPDDYETREAFAQDLAEIFRYALSHAHTDEDGTIRAEEDLLNVLCLLSTVAAERYDVPIYREYRDIFLWLGERLDGNQRLRDASERAGFDDFSIANLNGGED